MKGWSNRNVKLIALVIAAAILGSMPLIIMLALPDHVISQTETFQLKLMDDPFDHPGEAVINVSAPHTMIIGEGFQNVSISIHLVKQGNVTEFKLVKLDCNLGNLKNNRFHPDSSNWKIFDYVADDYQTGMLLYPSQASSEARIQLEMGIEVHYEDGHTSWCDLMTQPIFGFYDVQDRHLPIVILVTATLCGVLAVVWLDRK